MLTKAIACMIGRCGLNYQMAKDVAASMRWPVIGEDPADMVLCDGGNALVGLCFKQDPSNVQAGECCSVRYLDPFDTTIVNPTSEVECVPPSIADAVPVAAAHFGIARAAAEKRIIKERGSERLSFYDQGGNLTTFSRPALSEGAVTSSNKFTAKVHNLLGRRGISVRRRGDNPAVVLSLTWMVSDLETSRDFFKDALGLRVLRSRAQEVSFDAGTIILTIRAEDQLGLVRSFSRQDLQRDRVVFYVSDIAAEVQNLKRLNVTFPHEIESSKTAGSVAFFLDPDGHNLWLWQPPDQFTREMKINYYPVLDRILNEQGSPRPGAAAGRAGAGGGGGASPSGHRPKANGAHGAKGTHGRSK